VSVEDDAALLAENERLARLTRSEGERADLEHERAERYKELLASTEAQVRANLERRLTVENELIRVNTELELAKQRNSRLEEMLNARATQ
jgi:DNA repair exonuclease SbcCD ATPase subunit